MASRCHSPTCPHANGNPSCDQKSPLLNRRVVNRLAVGIAERMAQLGFLSPPESKPKPRPRNGHSSGQPNGHSSGQSNGHSSGQKSPRTVGAKVTTPGREKSTCDYSKAPICFFWSLFGAKTKRIKCKVTRQISSKVLCSKIRCIKILSSKVSLLCCLQGWIFC